MKWKIFYLGKVFSMFIVKAACNHKIFFQWGRLKEVPPTFSLFAMHLIIYNRILSFKQEGVHLLWLDFMVCCPRYRYLPHTTFKKECSVWVSATFLISCACFCWLFLCISGTNDLSKLFFSWICHVTSAYETKGTFYSLFEGGNNVFSNSIYGTLPFFI